MPDEIILSGKNGFLILDDCYNANPVSMKASVDVLDTAKGRKVCILGDMFELGENEKQLHYEVGSYLAQKQMDVLLTVGALSTSIAPGCQRLPEESCRCVSMQCAYIYNKRGTYCTIACTFKAGGQYFGKSIPCNGISKGD